jgi:outer membrane protein assembly factor BamB
MIGACNKNGVFYAWRALDLAGGPVWSIQLGDPSDVGIGKCLASAIWDGARLFAASNGTHIDGHHLAGSLRQLNPATGAILWETGLKGSAYGSPTLDGGGVIAAGTFAKAQEENNGVYLVKASDGTLITRIDTMGSTVFSQPVFAQDRMFLASVDAGLFAYQPGT